MNVTFNPNNIRTAEEIKAFGISRNVMAACDRAADVLRSNDNARKDTCDIRGIVSTDDYVKKHFFSPYQVKGSLSFDTETGKTKCMAAKTEESCPGYNMVSFVKQETIENEVFYQSGAYIVYQSLDGKTLTVQNDPNIVTMTI